MPKTRLLLVWEEEGRRDAGPKRDSEVRCFPWVRIQQNTNRKTWTILTNIIILELVAKKGKKGRERERERDNQKQERSRLISKARTRCSAVVVCIVTRRGTWIPGVSRDVVLAPYSYLSFLQILLPV